MIHTFPSICGGPGAFGVFNDDVVDIVPDIFEFDPNVLLGVALNEEEVTFKLGVLLQIESKNKINMCMLNTTYRSM